MYSSFNFDIPHNALGVYMPNPQQMRLTSGNQLYFPVSNSAVVKVDLNSGLVTRIAGSVTQFGYNQDGIPATMALLMRPNTVIQLDSGDLIISDTGNNRIRKIDTNGIISTIVGTGAQGNSGDYGPASKCQIHGPQGLAAPPESMKGQFLFDFADSDNSMIRRIQNDLTIVPLLNGQDGIAGPNGIVYTPNGDLYIASQSGYKVMKYSNGKLSTVAGDGHGGYTGDGGPAKNARLIPSDVTVSSTGEVYIADYGNNAIRKVFRNGTIITVFLNTNVIGPQLNGVTVTPDGDLFFSTGEHVNLLMNGNSGKCIDKNTCNNHGGCVNGKCVCDSGWRGTLDCGSFSCDIRSEHGEYCIGPNTYKCQDEWMGNLCDIPLCKGIPATNPTVCNSHGQCVSNDTCSCNSGWRGNNICTQFTCDGVNNCLPHGQCISNNICNCSDGYGGPGCNDRMCFGQWGQAGCSNNGNCANTNQCSCFSLYFGQKCQWLDCDPVSNDQAVNSTKGCSSNGQCTIVVNDQIRQKSTACKCNEGFAGQYCQDKAGNGGTVAAVVICLLIFICCLFGCIAVGAFIYYKKRTGSKSEELENLIPNSVNTSPVHINTEEEPTVKSTSTSSTVRSENNFLRTIRKQSTNTRDHFHIREKEYVKSKKLGSGANGTVFLFEEQTNKEQVAVKIIEVLNENGSEFKEVVNMFELSEDTNPHIVPILGCTMVESGGYICILMPLYKCDLRNWVYSNKEIVPIELIAEIVKQIALALQYLHSKNMVHRDLKQTNIFIAKSPDLSKTSVDVSSFQLCVGDWGSSRYQTRSNLTAYEGTIQYSAPESIVKVEFSPKSDVWSLGCILYQLLSGDYNTCLMRVKQPTMKDAADSKLLEIVEKFFAPRSDKSHKLYSIICDLMFEMLRYNPEERISTDQIINKLSRNNV